MFNSEEPVLKANSSFFSSSLDLSQCFNKTLNASQIKAIELALSAEYFALIQGPPGTGKTTVVVEFILQALTKVRGQILICAQSNVAVDNIAEKLIEYKSKHKELETFSFCRIGNPSKLLPGVMELSLEEIFKKKMEKIYGDQAHVVKLKGRERGQLVGEILKESRIILSTCVGAGDADIEWFMKRNFSLFDIVVIDECAQATEATCWIPILKGKKLIFY